MNLLVQKRLNYIFRNPALLEAALTHRSVSGSRNNERLEFLGDAMLNAIIAQALYEAYPKACEGELSRLRATLVKGDTLASIAAELGLGEQLLLGVGEKKSGGFRRTSILADALEALLAAVYLDSDFNTCRLVIQRLFQSRFETLPPVEELKDAKTRLQEYLQARQQPLPVYTVQSVAGEPHERRFIVECAIGDMMTRATGTSRRKAEQEAARKALEKIVQ